jgi:hypothetical protein
MRKNLLMGVENIKKYGENETCHFGKTEERLV